MGDEVLMGSPLDGDESLLVPCILYLYLFNASSTHFMAYWGGATWTEHVLPIGVAQHEYPTQSHYTHTGPMSNNAGFT